MRLISILFSLLLHACSAEAATIYVDAQPTANCIGSYNVNTRNCTGAATSYATPQAAANVTTAGDIVLFRAGTYTNPGGHVINISRSGGGSSSMITYKAYPAEIPIMQGDYNPVGADQYPIWVHANWIVIDGLHALNGTYGIYIDNGTDNIVKNSDVSFARGTGLFVYGGGSTRNHIGPNNIVHDNSQVNYPMGIVETWGAGIFAGYGAFGNVVDGNVSYFNHGEGISTGTCCQTGAGNDFFNNISSDNWSTNFYNDGSNNSRMSGNFSYVTAEMTTYVCPPGAFHGCNGVLARGYQFSVEIDAGPKATLQNITFDHNIAAGAVNGCWQVTADVDGDAYSNWRFYNNTCVGAGPIVNNWYQVGGGTIKGMTFKNNIFEIGNGPSMAQIQTGSGFSYIWDHNLWYGNGSFYFNSNPTNYAGAASTLSFTGIPVGTSPPNTSAGLVNAGAALPRLWGNQFGYGPGQPVSAATAAKQNYALAPGSIAINKGTTQITGSTIGACPSNSGGEGTILTISSFIGSCPDLGAIEFGGVASVGTLVVTAPTPNSITSSSTIAASGTSSCSASPVTAVTWVNNRGGSGTATGTTTWAVSSIGLTADRVNDLTFTVHCQ